MARPNPSNVSLYQACVLATATGESTVSFCKRTRVCRATVCKWQSDAEFARDVERLRRKMLDQAVGKFSGAVTTIADGMIKLAMEAVSEAVRLAAGRSVVENLMQISEFAELKTRLESIERKLDAHERELEQAA
jgi:hypothetical protein